MIPEYTIARIALDRHMQRQFDDEAHNDRPKVRPPVRTGVATAARLRMSAALHAIATSIEPPVPNPERAGCPDPI